MIAEMAVEPDDGELLGRYLDQGDQQAIAVIYTRHRSRVLRSLLTTFGSLTDTELEDLYHDAIVRLISVAPRLDRERFHNLGSYLARAAANRQVDLIRLAENRLRATTRQVAAAAGKRGEEEADVGGLLDAMAGVNDDPQADAVSRELRDRLRLGMARLPLAERELLEMRYFDQMLLADIGERLSITGQAARRLVIKAGNSLVRELRRTGEPIPLFLGRSRKPSLRQSTLNEYRKIDPDVVRSLSESVMPELRVVLIRIDLEGESTFQVAADLQVRRNYVRTLLNRARRRVVEMAGAAPNRWDRTAYGTPLTQAQYVCLSYVALGLEPVAIGTMMGWSPVTVNGVVLRCRNALGGITRAEAIDWMRRSLAERGVVASSVADTAMPLDLDRATREEDVDSLAREVVRLRGLLHGHLNAHQAGRTHVLVYQRHLMRQTRRALGVE